MKTSINNKISHPLKSYCFRKLCKIVLSVIIFTQFFYIDSYSQSYIPLPEDSMVKWQMDWHYINPFICNEEVFFDYVMRGDTIISNKSYKKLYIENSHIYFTFSGNPYCSNPPGNSYVAAFRQDSLTQKSFLVLRNDSIDTLLYDFTLNVGDTLKSIALGTLSACNCQTNVIDSIDSVLINNKFHLRQFIGDYCCGTSYIVEGFGSIFEPFIFQNRTEVVSELICVTRDTSFLLLGSTNVSQYCILPLSLDNVPKNNFIKVYPNPFKDHVLINANSEIKQVNIIEMSGRILISKLFDSSEIDIDVHSLNSGIYLLSIKLDSWLYNKLLFKY